MIAPFGSNGSCGMIREVDDLSHAMAKLWMGEAIVYKGRRVSLSIMNARVPIVGTLVDLTREGLLVNQDGGEQVAVSYARFRNRRRLTSRRSPPSLDRSPIFAWRPATR